MQAKRGLSVNPRKSCRWHCSLENGAKNLDAAFFERGRKSKKEQQNFTPWEKSGNLGTSRTVEFVYWVLHTFYRPPLAAKSRFLRLMLPADRSLGLRHTRWHKAYTQFIRPGPSENFPGHCGGWRWRHAWTCVGLSRIVLLCESNFSNLFLVEYGNFLQLF